ncbi:MAG: TIGR02452 family protein [Tannerella sp.]|jgi:uncharacterized protein (TIGR02452 family)|nr:TIGR02452 family protein [Tannerella sp.]
MTNNRNIRAKNAQETLDIIERGYYCVAGKEIQLKDRIDKSVEATVLYTPDYFQHTASDVEKLLQEKKYETIIEVKNCTSMEAATDLVGTGGRVGCLNFASAKNPGGGFLGGSQAQEESLARASTLYPTQMRYFTEMYEYNRSQHTYLYSDYMIYSPDVVFFKDDNDILLEQPYEMDILTSPAVNIGAMMQHKRQDELEQSEKVMMERLDKILSVFLLQGVDKLILGAWGCGVFRNDPKDVARYFAYFLTKDGKYAGAFKNIVFAVFDRSKTQENIGAFEVIKN